MSLSNELNEVIKQLQACRVSLALMTEHVQFQSDTYAQFLQWSADLEFVEALIGMWMEEKGLEKEHRVFTKHIHQRSHKVVYRIDPKLLNEEWIGGNHVKTERG